MTATVTDPDGNTSEFSYSPLLVGIEVTQAIQDIQNSVRLIEQKPTFVRAYLAGVPPTSTAYHQSAMAGLSGFRFPTDLSTSPLTPANVGEQILLVGRPSRWKQDESFLFELPPDWVEGFVELTVENQAFRCGEPHNLRDNSENLADQHNCKTVVEFRSGADLEITFVPIEWKEADGTLHRPSTADIHAAAAEIQATFGIQQISYDIAASAPHFPIIYQGPPSTKLHFRFLNALLEGMRKADGCTVDCDRYYIGIISDVAIAQTINVETLGMANSVGGDVASAFLDNHNTVSHELGHLAGRRHVDCTGRERIPDSSYPYDKGHISPF